MEAYRSTPCILLVDEQNNMQLQCSRQDRLREPRNSPHDTTHSRLGYLLSFIALEDFISKGSIVLVDITYCF